MRFKQFLNEAWNASRSYTTGPQKDYLKSLDATDDDIKAAVKDVKKLPVYKELLQYFDDVTADYKNALGTFVFRPKGKKLVPGGGYKENGWWFYMVDVRGQIRIQNAESKDIDGRKTATSVHGFFSRLSPHRTLLKSKKPLTANHGDPQTVIATNLENGFDELLAKAKKKERLEARKAAQQ